MTKQKHTPAPWEYNEGKPIGYWPYVQRGDSGGNAIQSAISLENAHADAKLYAAAPDLLEALEECLNHLYNPFEPENQSSLYLMAKKAISKATGK